MINKVSSDKKTPKIKKTLAAKAKAQATEVLRHTMHRRRVISGTVVSDKMTKTVVVKVDRRVLDQGYKKFVTISNRYKAHDEKGVAKVGDLVELVESKPISRTKRWAVTRVVRKGLGANVLDI
jgi:small subunit ribosomal protein S17